MNFKTLLSIAAIAAVTQVTGCTLVPVTTNLDVPVAKTVSATGPAVKIVSVSDNRKFVYPHEAGDCETPSVDGEKMLKDADAKARAFSRQGGCNAGEWGMHAMMSVPEGQTVAKQVEKALVVGIQDAGYRVDTNDLEASPVSISIINFWVSHATDGLGQRFSYWYDVDVTLAGSVIKVRGEKSEKLVLNVGDKAPKFGNDAMASLALETQRLFLAQATKAP